MAKTNEQNQTPSEEQAVVATGRKGLERAVQAMQSDIMAVAAPDVVKAGGTWLQRAVVNISGNDSLRGVLQSKAGILSVIKSMQKAATMGLQIGGQFPHCHLVGYQDKAELIVSAQGYRHAAVYGQGAVLQDVQIERVYEGDTVRIDKGNATVSHTIDPMNERGKLVGVYGIITRKDGTRRVEFMDRAAALRIRDAHSAGYKSGRPSPWKTDEDAMIEKTAAKSFLRTYAAEAEGLGMLYTSEDETEPQDWVPPPRNVSDRMSAHLETRAERVAEAPVKAPQVVEDVEAEVVDSKPAEAPAADGVELF